MILYSSVNLQEKDQKVLAAVQGKWVCRLPEELAALILRVLFDAQHSQLLSAKPQDHEKILKAFIDFLKEDRWRSWKMPDTTRDRGPKCPPLVPGTFCFDETRARIGISAPKWPDGKFKECHPWYEFVKKARDSRVSHPVVQKQFTEAENLLSTIRDTRDKRVSEAEWNRIQLEFQDQYDGPLRRYSNHIWQAVDPWLTFKDPCWRDRCYYDAKLLKHCGKWDSQDTAPSRRRLRGPCAESCLHAEEIESGLE
ncbi:MAG: hypothetical protein M1820_007199 [Bogoriella megaspora]|nr:MAG: hypothetical protein M1820_007199 [Bogoriella megaspora]